MAKLTEAQRRALAYAPYVGFPAGSNMWPLCALSTGGADEVPGEDVDQMLRLGLLEARPLDEPVLTDRSPNPDVAPDCECTHNIAITDAGRAALQEDA